MNLIGMKYNISQRNKMCHRSKDTKNELIIRIWLSGDQSMEHKSPGTPCDKRQELSQGLSQGLGQGLGHISLEIPKNNIYASFWPLQRNRFICQACEMFRIYDDPEYPNKIDTNTTEKFVRDKHFAGFQHYKKWIPKEPDFVFKLYSMDVDKITESYLKFWKEMRKNYEVCANHNHNVHNCGFRYIQCSNTIYRLLQSGGLDNLLKHGYEYGCDLLDMYVILAIPRTTIYLFNAIKSLEQIYFGKQMNLEIIDDDKATRIWFAKLGLAKDKIPKKIMSEIEDFKILSRLDEIILSKM